MSFFQAKNVQSITAGLWLQRPSNCCVPNGISIDTRMDLAGKIFIAIKGQRFDGHDFLEHAAKAGPALLIVDRKPSEGLPPGIGVLHVESTRLALANLARA